MYSNTLKSSSIFNPSVYFTWFLTSFFFAFQMTLRVLPGIMMDDIMTKFNMDIAQFGLLAGFYYLGYAGAQIPIGLMLDKYNPRYVLSICIGICSLGLVCFSNFDTIFFAYLGRFLIGVGSVAGILGAIKVIDDFFSYKYSLMLGFTVLIGVSGAFYGGAPVSAMLELSPANTVLNYLAIFGLLLALVIMIFYTKQKSLKHDMRELDMKEALKICFYSKQLWLIGIFAGFMVGSIEGFADVWGIKYLIQVHMLSPIEASFAASLIFLGFGVGGPVLGLISNKFLNEITIVILCGISMIVCYFILFFTPYSNIYLIYSICFFIGLFSDYQVIVFGIISKTSEHRLVGLMSSFLNMLIMSFGFVFHYSIGQILELTPPITTHSNIVIYSANAYHMALSIIVIGLVIGSLGFMKLNKSLNNII